MFKRLIKLTQGKKKNKGFSLVELLVAIILLAIVITPMFNAFISSARINRNARRIMVATDLGQNIIEGLSEKTYETVYQAVKSSEMADLQNTCAFTTMNDGAYNISSNWIMLTNHPQITSNFDFISPETIRFVTLDGITYVSDTKDLISDNRITESMNRIIQKAASDFMSGQQVYYCLLDSNHSDYPDEGVIYLVYTNILDPNKELDGGVPGPDDYAYNAIVSIIPTASDLETKNYYFTYNVKVTLYSTDNYDPSSTNPFGEPIITVLGGIPSK